MFYLWICLSLFFVLQSTVSSDQGVSVNCNKTAEVGKSKMYLKCPIHWKDGSNCRVLNYTWENTNGPIQCNWTNYSCEWDPQKYVALTIQRVTKEENVTVEIRSDCGMAKSGVQLLPIAGNGGGMQESHVMAIILCVFPTAVYIFTL